MTAPDGRRARPRGPAAASTASSASSDRDPAVGSVVGLPAVLRLRRELAGQGDDAARATRPGWRGSPPTSSSSCSSEPSLRRWVDMASLGSTYLTVTARAGDDGGSPR